MSDRNQGTNDLNKMARNFEQFFMAFHKVWSIILHLLDVLKASLEIKHLIGKSSIQRMVSGRQKKLC